MIQNKREWIPVSHPNQKNTGSNLFHLGHSNFFQDMSLKARETKAKMNSWDFIKIKSFHPAKETIDNTKRRPTESKKIFANDITEKWLVSKIYKELLKLNTQNTNNPVEKWAEDTNRHFSQEDTQMADRHVKTCSTSLAVREIQIKTALRHHLHQSEWLKRRARIAWCAGCYTQGMNHGTLHQKLGMYCMVTNIM